MPDPRPARSERGAAGNASSLGRLTRILVISGAVLLTAMAGLLWLASQSSRNRDPLPILGETRAFTVTNQAGARLDSDSLRGRPWAIDLIFTRCPGPCRTLTALMRRIQDSLPADSNAGLISVTSDPEFDTPAVLARYAAGFGANSNRWHFVTADKAGIRRLATEELRLVLVEKPAAERESPDDLFLHSTLVVVMDGQGRLRAVVEGLEHGAAEKVLAVLKQLEKEG